ncbi:MAG TPA: hypothetical protein VIF62_21745 [Labilithrix sp.]|jgi:hypothetical protein
MRRSFLLFSILLTACSSSSSDSTADAGRGDGGATDAGNEGGTGDDGGTIDAGPTIVGKGASCGMANRVCGPGLYCKHGTGPMMFVGTCEDQLKEGDACAIDSPSGKVDSGGCGAGLVCDLGLNMCVKKM